MKIYQITYKTSVADNHFFFDIKEMRWCCVIMFDSNQRTHYEKYFDNIDENRQRTYCEPFEYVLPNIINYLDDTNSLSVSLQKIESSILLKIFDNI